MDYFYLPGKKHTTKYDYMVENAHLKELVQQQSLTISCLQDRLVHDKVNEKCEKDTA